MSGERKISIIIDTQGNVSGIDAVTDRFKHSEGAASHLFETLKAGAAIDIGGRLVEGIARIPESFQRAIDRGVEFNRRMQDTQINVAAMLKQFDSSGRLKTFDDAMAQSGDLMELFRRKAKESSSTLADLLANYQVSAGTFAQANVPLEKQVELTEKLTDALDAMGIHSERARLELRALFAGDATGGTLMKRLGITPEELAAAKASGQLFDFLSAKTAGYAAAGVRSSQSLSVATAKLGEAIDEILGKVSKPVFEALTTGTLNLTKALDDPALVEDLRSLGEQVAAMTKLGYDLTKWAVENSDVLVFLAKAAAGLGATLTAIKLTNFILDLGRQAVAFVGSAAAINAETAALARNTAAQVANGAARGGAVVPSNLYGRAYDATRAEEAAAAAASAQRARMANAGNYLGPVASPAARGAAGMAVPAFIRNPAGGAGAMAALGTVATGVIVSYVVAEMISRNMLANADAREASANAAGTESHKKTNGFLGRSGGVSSSEEKSRLLLDISKARKEFADLQAEFTGKDDLVASIYGRQVELLDMIFDKTRSITAAEMDRRSAAAAVTADLQRHKDILSAMADPASKLAQSYEKLLAAEFGQLSDADKLTTFGARRASLRLDLPVLEKKAETGKADDLAAVYDAKAKIVELDEVILNLEKKASAELASQVDKLGKQAQSKQDYVLDFQILQAQASGNDAIVKKLEHQKALREEIKKIMDATGVTEEEALRAATRKLALQDQLAARGKTGAPSTANRLPSTVDHSGALGAPGTIQTHPIGEGSIGISSFDYRNNGIIGGFGRIVPRLAPSGVSSSGIKPAADIGSLGDAVKKAQEAFDKDGTLASKKKLTDEINMLTAALEKNKSKEDPVIRALITAVAQLRTQVAGLRAR